VQVDPDIEVITGRAIAETGGPFMRTMVINVGTEHGVSKGQAVINERGLVGWIVGAGQSSSRVLLATDLNSRIPVMIGEDGDRAILQGDNTSSPRLEFLMALEDVKEGATVMTSGDAGILPKGLPVGVMKARARKTGYYHVDWAAGGGPIDYVRVLNYEFPKNVDIEEEGLPAGLLEAVRDGVPIVGETTPAEPAESTAQPPATDD
jgi:rod shape-determining protein MreC